MRIQTHYSAAELAAFRLPMLPSTERGVRVRAAREQWLNRPRQAKGGGLEYALNGLPVEIRTAIQHRTAAQLIAPTTAPVRVVQPGEVQVTRGVVGIQQALPGITDRDRLVADARKGVLLALRRIQEGSGCNQAAALTTLLKQAAAGFVDPMLLSQLRAAKTTRGRKGTGGGLPSHRTLMRWLAAEKRNDLIPKKVLPDMSLPAWAPAFMAEYRQPQKPPVTEAYKVFAREWMAENACRVVPSIHAVRRFLDKLPADLLVRGRRTGAELKSVLPFVFRDWSLLSPNDVWIGDGHGLKAKVAHPDHGKPFVPEITLILDGFSRAVMGWSVAYSENQIAVGDALRHAVSQYGKSLVYYSDNGAGQTPDAFDDPTLGTLPRLSIHHATGIPGSPQGRGIIERAWQTITIPLARKLATFRGAGMDRETLRKTNQEIESALKRGETSSKLPTWDQFVDALEEAIAEYNYEHEHSSLPKNRATGRYYAPMTYYEERLQVESIERPSQHELIDLFRPYVLRTVERGWVRLWNNRYFAADLSRLANGTQVRVGYDIHDAQNVVIRDLDGGFICLAEWNGNRRAAFPISFRDQLAEQRAERMKQRGEEIIDRANAELTRTYTAPALEQQDVISIPGITPIKRSDLAALAAGAIEGQVVPAPAAAPAEMPRPTAEVVPLVTPDMRWDRWWRIDTELNHGDDVPSEEDLRFYRQYQKGPEFKARRAVEGAPAWVAARAGAV